MYFIGSLLRDTGGAHGVERRGGDRGNERGSDRPAGHLPHLPRLHQAQQHARRQGEHARAQLPHPRGNDPLAFLRKKRASRSLFFFIYVYVQFYKKRFL